MATKGTFNIPRHAHNSTRGARTAFANAFGHEWPHDNAYLREISAEAATCNELIILMRECDTFETTH